MVTKEYIDNIRETARLWQPYDQAAAEQALRQYLQLGLPDWDPAADSLLSRSIPLLVDVLRVQSETAHANVRRGLLAFAEGEDLDIIGLGPPAVFRLPGEADDDYRVRIALAQAGISIGSLTSIEHAARRALPAIIDVVAVTAPNRQDVSVFACKADCELLTNAEVTSLTEYLNARDGVIAGVQITAPAPTKVAYTISVKVRYRPANVSTNSLEALVRMALYEFIDRSATLGQDIYRSAITDAAYLPGTERVEVVAPAYDLAPPELVVKPAAGDTTGQGARVTARVTPTQGATPAWTGPISAADVLYAGGNYSAAPLIEVLGGTEGTGATFTGVLGTGDAAGTLASVTIGGGGGSKWRAGLQHDFCPLYVCPKDETNVVIEMVAI